MHTSIKIDEDIQKRVELVTDGTETMSQFVKKSTLERLKRMEARDDRCIRQSDEKLKKMIKETINDMLDRGELKYE